VQERQKTEEALRKSEERYALAVQGSNDGIWDLNMVTGEAYHSSRWKSILGFEEDEISGNFKEWEKRVHPDDYERVMEVGKAYEEGRIPSFEVEYRIRHKDGGYRWVLTRGACLRDSQGKPYRMAGSLTDIASRKVMEEGRRRNEALLKCRLETLPVGVWIWKNMAVWRSATRRPEKSGLELSLLTSGGTGI
jgi:PAS domain S-box-containing protein